MKREVRRKHVTMTPAEKARWQQAVREEQAAKGANIAHAQELRRRTTEVRAELTRVAELLKQERQAQGVSLSELQERTGIHKTALCRLESLAQGNPTIGTLTRIAEALGKTLVVGLQNQD